MSDAQRWVINPVEMTVHPARPGERGFDSETEAIYELMKRLRQRMNEDLRKHSQLSERAALLVARETAR